MAKYLVLLRGINVGGNNIIKMANLKACLTAAGFANIGTYIQSGNVILESTGTDRDKLTARIEKVLSTEFGYQASIVVVSAAQYKRIMAHAPKWWGKAADYRHNLIFVKPPITATEALAEVLGDHPKPDIEHAEVGEGVIYVSDSREHIHKTNFSKVPSLKVYKYMTIRNYNTSQKLLKLMES